MKASPSSSTSLVRALGSWTAVAIVVGTVIGSGVFKKPQAVAVAETMMVESRSEGVLILAKVSGMQWSTVKAIINMRDDLSGMDRADLEACRQTYERLRTSTAQQVLRFHRMQQTAAPAA